MFAKVRSHKSVSRILGYNELKVEREKAECVLAKAFVKDLDCLDRDDKLFHFERLTSLNERAKMNAVHISLSFFPEDRLSGGELLKIAQEYMEKIGFGSQPYLVYRHQDTRHPHFHIVSTNIRTDGSRLDLREIMRSQSLKVTQEMEIAYGLRTTEQNRELSKGQDNNAIRIEYGELPLKPAIQNVLTAVIDQYKYKSLEELNAVLRLYNVRAYRGQEGSRLYERRGILYGLLDKNGKSIGAPLKASSFDRKPTLKRLEEKFAQNAPLLQKQDQRVKTAIDWILATGSYSLNAFKDALEKERISAVYDSDKLGQFRHIYYVDHETWSVFDGEGLGAKYGVQAIREKCKEEDVLEQEESLTHHITLNL